jgi:hypothetical protein
MGLPIWGEPKPLSFTDDIKAMQVLGRAGELIYFTQQISPVPAWPLPQVRQPYDQCFVAILCSHQIAVSNTFYARLFETPEPEILRSKVAGLSRLGGLSSDALHSISALAMGCGHWLEIDQGLSDLSIELGGIQAGIYSISIHSDTVISFARGFGVAVKSSINTSCHFLSGPSGEKINWYQEQGV